MNQKIKKPDIIPAYLIILLKMPQLNYKNFQINIAKINWDLIQEIFMGINLVGNLIIIHINLYILKMMGKDYIIIYITMILIV